MNNALLTGQSDHHIVYLDGPNGSFGIHQAMQTDWLAMQKAAREAGISLNIASGFRDFDRQLSIWNRKFSGELAVKNLDDQVVNISALSETELIKAILLFSALPGASRHHWGTDIDVYDHQALAGQPLSLSAWEYQTLGPFAKLSLWLKEHAGNFGFYFPYDHYRNGVAAEPWHLSYAPLAKGYQQALSIELITSTINKADICGKATIINLLPTIFSQYITNLARPNL